MTLSPQRGHPGIVRKTGLGTGRAAGQPTFITRRATFEYFWISPEIIRLAVMLYVQCPLSLRNVKGLSNERSINLSQPNDHSRKVARALRKINGSFNVLAGTGSNFSDSTTRRAIKSREADVAPDVAPSKATAAQPPVTKSCRGKFVSRLNPFSVMVMVSDIPNPLANT